MNNKIEEIKINKNDKSIFFINNGIAFSQFGIVDEILDLIINLQEENKELNRMCELYSKSLYNAELTKAKEKIDKAIEYCEEITSREIDISDTDYDLGQDFTARDILNILRGEE